jgi:hypothetical protein
MLKVNIDRGGDYLDYLVPFVLQTLVDHRPDPVTAPIVSGHVRNDFGLEIPDRAVQLVIQRISRKYPNALKRDNHVYQIQGELPNPSIASKKADADRHIHAVVNGLIEFSKSTAKPLSTDDEAVEAICRFLAEFNIPYLRAYLRGSAIPDIPTKRGTDIALVSQYVVHLQQTNPERFDSFLIMLQGHMLANALLCPDLDQAPKSYKNVTFYFDTPLLLNVLGVQGAARKEATDTLIRLLSHLGAKVAAFSHTRDELSQVLRGAAEHINSPNGRGLIITEARQSEITKSDLILLAASTDEKLASAHIDIIETPEYLHDLQIDQKSFEAILDSNLKYSNPHAKDHDVNSVRSIYVLRGHRSPSSIERARATLATSNTAFARAAYEYDQNCEPNSNLSSVITDFSLANMAWLKAPMGSPSLPKLEVLSFSYAALKPSNEFLEKFLAEVDKLEKQGKISTRDHQLLRSSVHAQEEVMKLTLGDDAALTGETILQTLERVSAEVKHDEAQRTKAAVEAQLRTRKELENETSKTARLRERIYWKCDRQAKQIAWSITAFVVLVLVIGLFAGLGIRTTNKMGGWLLTLGSGFSLLYGFVRSIWGVPVMNIQGKIYKYAIKGLLLRESRAIGLNVEESVED